MSPGRYARDPAVGHAVIAMRGLKPRAPLPTVVASKRQSEPPWDSCARCDRGFHAISAELRIATTVTRLQYEMEHGHLFIDVNPLVQRMVWTMHCEACHEVGEQR